MKKLLKNLPSVLLALSFCPFAVQAESVTLNGPEVSKIDWNARSLVASDVDGDGLKELLFINNDHARIDILYQGEGEGDAAKERRTIRQNRWDPVLEDSRFHRDSIVTGVSMYALAAGDLNSDGRTDLVFTSKDRPLNVLYQNDGGEWKDKTEYDDLVALPWTSTLQIQDVNGDQLNDLIVLSNDSLLIYAQNKAGELEEPTELLMTEQNIYGLEIKDVNQDGLLDVLYLVMGSDRALRIRQQNADAGFGPELSLSLEMGSNSIGILSGEADAALQFAYVQPQTRLIETMEVVEAKADMLPNELFPQIYATGTSAGSAKAYALADFDGDGREDLALGDSGSAQVYLYYQKHAGLWGEAIDFPSLSGVTLMQPARFKSTEEKSSLVMLSPKEKILGVSRFNEQGRLLFPEVISLEGEPQTFALGELFSTGDALELIVVEKRGRKYWVSVHNQNETGEGFAELDSFQLEDIKRKPDEVMLADFNGDGRSDLFFLVSKGEALFFIQQEDGKFVAAAEKSAIRKSLLSNLSAEQIGFSDWNGDGELDFLVTGPGYVRSLKLTDDEFVITEQWNTKHSDDEVSLPQVFDFDEDGATEVVLFVEDTESFQILERDAQGVFRYDRSLKTGEIQPLGSRLIYKDGLNMSGQQSTAAPVSHLLVLGRKHFWMVPLTEDGLQVQSLYTYETDLKDVVHNRVAAGDLNHDGKEEIILVDGKNHVLEVLRFDASEEQWKSSLHFTIFDENMHYGGRRGGPFEPREVLVDDLTGDGKDDLVFLVHDRILLYPQGGEDENSG